MQWHDIQDPRNKLLDELAARYSPHPLHVDDCRQKRAAHQSWKLSEVIYSFC